MAHDSWPTRTNALGVIPLQGRGRLHLSACPFDRALGTAVPRPIRAIYASYERCSRKVVQAHLIGREDGFLRRLEWLLAPMAA